MCISEQQIKITHTIQNKQIQMCCFKINIFEWDDFNDDFKFIAFNSQIFISLHCLIEL